MSTTEDATLLAADVAFWATAVDDPDTTVKELGRLSQELAPKFRALGILLLLSRNDRDQFVQQLSRSARVRLAYLKRLNDLGLKADFLQASGRYQPLLAGIAATDWTTAGAIIALSPSTKLRGEYEDDHCLAQVVAALVNHVDAPQRVAEPFLLRWAEHLAGEMDARYEVLRAIVNRDQEGLDAAFFALGTRFEAEIAAARQRGQQEDIVIRALRLVDVDALAMLRLAERRGLHTANEYPYCPANARAPHGQPLSEI